MGPNALKFFHSLARKGLTKNRGSGITEIADRMEVEGKAASMIQAIVDSGLPLERFDQFIRSEADVLKFLNIIKNTKPVSTTERASGVVIPFKQKRSFAEEIEAMKKRGDLVDVDDIKISDKITEREMFKNSFLNKNRSSDDLPPPGSRGGPDDIAAPVQSAEESLRDMTEAEIKAKLQKQNKESIQRFKDKMKKDEPEDKADGGRMGFRAGKFVLDKIIATFLKDKNKMKQAADDIFPTGDYKMDAQMAAEALVENNPKIFRNKLYDDLDTRTQIEVYGAVLEPIQKNMALIRQLKKASRPEKTLESMKKGEGIDMSNPDIADEFARFMKETDPQGSKTIEQTVELSNFDPKGRKKNATGGRAGHYTGGIVDVEPTLSDIGHGSDALMARTRLMSPGSQATTSTGLNYLLAEDNDNIRVPFKFGGDAGRRAFLKLLAALTGGVAAAKSGILGLGEGTAKKAVSETVKKSVGSQPPPYFFRLVEKIKFMGDDTLASQDKAIAKKYKDYVMEEDFAGNITIIKKDMDNPYPTEVYMNYKVDDVALKNKKGYAKAEEYEEFTARPDMDGKMKDIEQGVPDEVIEEAGDTTAMTLKEKAEGGRIGFRIGGSPKKFLEKVFGKEKFKIIVENDPEMYQGMLEVVDMFRRRDKEGLKMYLQKFLPHMDDATIEDFIIGGEGTEGITGQLIRLGSGRDYKGKLDMIKEAENIRKLENFDIEGVSKNAEGGRIGFSGGGIFRAIIARAAAKQGLKPYEFMKVTSYKSLPPEVKMFMSKADFEKLKFGQEQMYSNYIDMAKTRKSFQEQVEAGKTTPAKELFESMEKMMDEQSFVPKNVTNKDIAEMELMVKNRFNKGRKDNAAGGIQTMLGE